MSCHNPSGGAPFNLQNYADAKQWGGQMLDVTQSRYMPPWLPVADLHHPQSPRNFKGERRLSDADLESIRRWVSSGMPEGPPSAAITYDSASLIKQAGHPDLTLSLPAPIHVPASGPDIFVTVALPVPAGSSHAIRAVAIAASDPQAAHSILIGVDNERALREQHPEVTTAGLPGMELSPQLTAKFAPSGQLLLWTPDNPLLTPSTSFTLKGGSDLIITAHIKTTGRAEDLTLQTLIYYAKAAHPAAAHALLHIDHDDALEIPAGEKQFSIDSELKLDKPTTIAAIYPHAHYTARTLEAMATLPDGTQRSLLTIDKWDADWTAIYRFLKPVILPTGTTLHLHIVCDNSSNNPHNPSDPPKKVTAGHSAKDEVAEIWFETN